MLLSRNSLGFREWNLVYFRDGGSVSKESACSAGDRGSVPELGRSSEGGHGNPCQYSFLENPLDRGGSPRTGRPQSMVSHRVRHDWTTNTLTFFEQIISEWLYFLIWKIMLRTNLWCHLIHIYQHISKCKRFKFQLLTKLAIQCILFCKNCSIVLETVCYQLPPLFLNLPLRFELNPVIRNLWLQLPFGSGIPTFCNTCRGYWVWFQEQGEWIVCEE